VRNLASFKTSLNFEPPAFEYAAIYPNSDTKVQWCDDRPDLHCMSWPSLVKLGLYTPLRKLCQLWPTPYNCTRKRAKMRLSVDHSISLKFCTEFKRLTPEVL